MNNPNDWKPKKWERLRAKYAYPPARLIAAGRDTPELDVNEAIRLVRNDEQVDRDEIDRYHEDLLTSSNRDVRLTGLLSVVYWGFYASADGSRLPTSKRALARARWIVFGKNDPPKICRTQAAICRTQAALNEGLHFLRNGKNADALRVIMSIDYIGMSFASKVLMFADPKKAVVYDRVVYEKLKKVSSCHPEFKDKVVNPLGPFTKAKGEAYLAWCTYCQDKADSLNGRGSQWTDTRETRRAWRAVDVERTFFVKSL